MERGSTTFLEDSGRLQAYDGAYPTGKIEVIGNTFQFSVNVSEFAPEDVIITSSNNLIEVHAEKMAKDGTITNTLSHRCKLPAEVDPVSVTLNLGSNGVLTVRAQRMQTTNG
ncbi:heat shock protein beta-7-like [Eucyclogobius newberryi]|uniref:heat shock protein beta-7-like n=1 Tax=Eucyclogobius newberryi TaxID=166745 RepID=UPI003B5C9634